MVLSGNTCNYCMMIIHIQSYMYNMYVVCVSIVHVYLRQIPPSVLSYDLVWYIYDHCKSTTLSHISHIHHVLCIYICTHYYVYRHMYNYNYRNLRICKHRNEKAVVKSLSRCNIHDVYNFCTHSLPQPVVSSSL